MSLLTLLIQSGAGAEKKELLVIDGVTYPNIMGQQTDLNLMEYGLGNYQWSPQVWTVLDKTFVVVTDNESNSEYHIYVLDHYTKKVSNSIATGLLAEGNDVHHIAAIISTALDKILITETSFHGAAGNWKYSLSGDDYNINNFDIWTDSGINQNTYHQLQTFANGDIYNIQRYASISTNFAYIELYKSTDNGGNFSKIQRVLDWGVSPNINRYIPYPMLIYSSDDVLRLVINNNYYTYDGSSSQIGFQKMYYIESHDGGTTWRNVNNTFSKDVSIEPLTLSEMDNNCLSYSLPAPTDAIRANGSFYDIAPYIIGGSGDVSNSPTALYYWSGSAWIQKVVTCSGHTINSCTNNSGAYNNSTSLFKNGSSIDLICSEDVAGVAQMSRFRTSDLGDTWTFIEQITTGVNDHWQAHENKNISTAQYKSFACVDRVGSTDRLFIKEI